MIVVPGTDGSPLPGPGDAPRLDLLTNTERCFIKLCCDKAGLPYKLIGVRMGIALSTVHTHREKVFAKLKVPSRTALVLLALRYGLH